MEVKKFEMPKRPPCAGCEKDDKTVICVYRKPGSSIRNKRNLYLQVDCLDWLLSYAADELHFQGVVRTNPEPSAKPTGNCSAVADLHLEWDFDAKAWEAEFVAGAFAGRKQRFSFRDLTHARWTKMKAWSLVACDTVSYTHLTLPTKA